MSNQTRSIDLLDILFRGRNKAYGAYELRRSYSTNIKKALIYFLLIVLLLSAAYIVAGIIKNNQKLTVEKPIRTVTELTAPPPMDDKRTPPPPPPPPPPPVKATIQFVPPKIVEVARPEEEIKTVEEVVESKAQVSTQTVQGQEVPAEIELGPVGDGKVVSPKVTEPFSFVEQMPEFPGGEEALVRYLSKNIRYPQFAVENEIEGTVMVEFVVSEDGSIQNPKILKGLKGGCDQEALRVVKSMPKWKAGRQAGIPVPVIYSVPVTFKLD